MGDECRKRSHLGAHMIGIPGIAVFQIGQVIYKTECQLVARLLVEQRRIPEGKVDIIIINTHHFSAERSYAGRKRQVE